MGILRVFGASVVIILVASLHIPILSTLLTYLFPLDHASGHVHLSLLTLLHVNRVSTSFCRMNRYFISTSSLIVY
jgi:hypothetical protein